MKSNTAIILAGLLPYFFGAVCGRGGTFEDNFDDCSLHSWWWRPSASGGSIIDETSGRIEMTQGSSDSAALHFRWPVEGDFTVEVDYELLNWPTPNTQSVALVVRDLLSNHVASIARVGQTDFGGDGYVSFTVDMGLSVSTPDTSGTLFMSRAGNVITTNLHSAPGHTTGPVLISLEFGSHGPSAGARIAFDDFVLIAPDMPELVPCQDNPGAVELDPSWINVWADEDTIDNRNPAVAYNPLHDEYLVVWENHRANMVDIHARRVAGSGDVLSWFSIATNPGKTNDQPVVAYSPAQDEYLVAYIYHYSGSDYDVWARRVAWDGSWMSAEFPIDQSGDLQWNPSLAYNEWGDEYLLVYENWWSGGTRDIVGKRLGSNGVLLTTRSIAGGTDFTRGFPAAAWNEARNQYLVAYTRNIGTNGDVFCRLLSAETAVLTVETSVCSDSYDQDFVSIAAGPDEYLAVWEDGVWGTDGYNIYARRIAGDGTPLGSPGGFPIARGNESLHVDPDVAFAPGGNGYLVAWRHFSPMASGQDVFARWVLRGEDAAFGGEFPVDATSQSQAKPAVAASPWGRYLVVEEDGWPGPDLEIRGRFLSPQLLIIAGTGKAQPQNAPGFWWHDWGCGWMYTVEAKNAWADAWSEVSGHWPTRASEWIDLSAVEGAAPQRLYRVRAHWSPPPQ